MHGVLWLLMHGGVPLVTWQPAGRTVLQSSTTSTVVGKVCMVPVACCPPGQCTMNERCTSPDPAACLPPPPPPPRDSQMYDIYLLPPGEDPETCQCWLRMRNRDGRYSLMFEEWVTDGAFIISPRISFEVRGAVKGLRAGGPLLGGVVGSHLQLRAALHCTALPGKLEAGIAAAAVSRGR